MKKWFLIIIPISVILFHHHAPILKWGGVGIEKVELLELHNAQRQEPLSMIIELDKAAQLHAEWMAENNDMDHYENNPAKRDLSKRVEREWKAIGENIACGQLTADQVTNDWMHSPGHRANILNRNFHHVGFGIATSNRNEKYWCAVFSD